MILQRWLSILGAMYTGTRGGSAMAETANYNIAYEKDDITDTVGLGFLFCIIPPRHPLPHCPAGLQTSWL